MASPLTSNHYTILFIHINGKYSMGERIIIAIAIESAFFILIRRLYLNTIRDALKVVQHSFFFFLPYVSVCMYVCRSIDYT
ncbi:hypothetical protein BDF14DRAFT_1851255 [Spinellus fusiger]|nr:hypothetical protein BDF14DRAFT_1851255 [Spinellus fusiger]